MVVTVEGRFEGSKETRESGYWRRRAECLQQFRRRRLTPSQSACYFWPGSEAEIQHRRPFYYEKYNKTTPFKDRVAGVLEWLGRVEDRPSFITLYMESVDTEGHIYGPDSSENYKVAAAVSQVDNAVRMLFARNFCVGFMRKIFT